MKRPRACIRLSSGAEYSKIIHRAGWACGAWYSESPSLSASRWQLTARCRQTPDFRRDGPPTKRGTLRPQSASGAGEQKDVLEDACAFQEWADTLTSEQKKRLMDESHASLQNGERSISSLS